MLVDDLQEPRPTAFVLHVRLTIRARCREVEHIELGDERGELISDRRRPSFATLDAGVRLARALRGLDRLHRGRERNIAGICFHGVGFTSAREPTTPAPTAARKSSCCP